MGKKKHKKKKKEAEQRSVLQTPSCEIFSSEAINQATERIRQMGKMLGMIGRQAVSLPLGGGTVRTARITSKGISFHGRRHYNSDYIQAFCGREVLIHEVGGKMKAYLYDETSKLLMRIICEVDISQVETGNLIDGLPGEGERHIMEKLASVSIDEKEQIYLNGKLLENVTAYKLENSTNSKEPAKLTVTMFVNVGQECLGMQNQDEAFYKDLISQKAEAQTLSEDLIQKMSKERPDVVLACIGIHHPASEVVLQYLTAKVYQEWQTKDPALFINPWSEIIKRRSL